MKISEYDFMLPQYHSAWHNRQVVVRSKKNNHYYVLAYFREGGCTVFTPANVDMIHKGANAGHQLVAEHILIATEEICKLGERYHGKFRDMPCDYCESPKREAEQEAEQEPTEIVAGKFYKCLETKTMQEGRVAFWKDKIYEATYKDTLKSEVGESHGVGKWDQFFEEVTESLHCASCRAMVAKYERNFRCKKCADAQAEQIWEIGEVWQVRGGGPALIVPDNFEREIARSDSNCRGAGGAFLWAKMIQPNGKCEYECHDLVLRKQTKDGKECSGEARVHTKWRVGDLCSCTTNTFAEFKIEEIKGNECVVRCVAMALSGAPWEARSFNHTSTTTLDNLIPSRRTSVIDAPKDMQMEYVGLAAAPEFDISTNLQILAGVKRTPTDEAHYQEVMAQRAAAENRRVEAENLHMIESHEMVDPEKYASAGQEAEIYASLTGCKVDKEGAHKLRRGQ